MSVDLSNLNFGWGENWVNSNSFFEQNFVWINWEIGQTWEFFVRALKLHGFIISMRHLYYKRINWITHASVFVYWEKIINFQTIISDRFAITKLGWTEVSWYWQKWLGIQSLSTQLHIVHIAHWLAYEMANNFHDI